MSFAAALAAETPTRRGQQCSTCLLLSTAPKGDVVTLQAALDDQSISGATISRALTSYGQQIGSSAVQRHRRGDCVK